MGRLPVSRPLDCLLRSEARPLVWWAGHLQATLLPAFLPILAGLLLSPDPLPLAVRPLDCPLLDLHLFQERTSTPRSFPLAPLRWSTMRSTSLTDCQSQSLKRS